MKRKFGIAALALLFSVAAICAETASSPTGIRPLLIGSSTPSVEVQAADGTTINLADKVQDQRTVLIFYRGGW